MRDHVRRNLALVERAILASILPGVAGVINASGFFAVGVYTSHMTGNLDFHPTFTAELLRKDFDLGLAAARERDVPLPVASLVHQLVQSLIGHGYAGQDFAALKNALFYPKSLLAAINGGDVQSEVRPYDLNFTPVAADEIPNANGTTDPNTGLVYAFNLLSPSSLLPASTYGTLKGRRGASKVVVLETDGVPNAYRGLSSAVRTMDPAARGYDTYYPDSAWSSGNVGNGNATSMSEALKVVQQIVKPMAAQGDAQGSTADSGLGLPNAPARVYAVAFGDMFDPDASPNATFRPTALQFLANVAAAGGTGPAGATTIPDYQIITGPYDQRIRRLKDCMERIFQSGVSVALIE